MDPLASFSDATRVWFERTFDAPTPPQRLGWPAIAGQPCSCAGVGASNVRSNHSRVFGENTSSAATRSA